MRVFSAVSPKEPQALSNHPFTVSNSTKYGIAAMQTNFLDAAIGIGRTGLTDNSDLRPLKAVPPTIAHKAIPTTAPIAWAITSANEEVRVGRNSCRNSIAPARSTQNVNTRKAVNRLRAAFSGRETAPKAQNAIGSDSNKLSSLSGKQRQPRRWPQVSPAECRAMIEAESQLEVSSHRQRIRHWLVPHKGVSCEPFRYWGTSSL